MNTAVRYYSKTGNTKVIAEAVARAAGCRPETIDVPLSGEVDLLLLGGSIYWGMIPGVMKDFIKKLSPETIRYVAVFTTAGVSDYASHAYQMYLKVYDFKVLHETYFCHRKQIHDPKTKEEAGAFARFVVRKAEALDKR